MRQRHHCCRANDITAANDADGSNGNPWLLCRRPLALCTAFPFVPEGTRMRSDCIFTVYTVYTMSEISDLDAMHAGLYGIPVSDMYIISTYRYHSLESVLNHGTFSN